MKITTYLVKRRGCAMTWRKTSFAKTTKFRGGKSSVATSNRNTNDAIDIAPLFMIHTDDGTLYSFSQDKIDPIMTSWLRDLETF